MTKHLQNVLATTFVLMLIAFPSFASPLANIVTSDDAKEVLNFDENVVYSQFTEIQELTNTLLESDISASEISNKSLISDVYQGDISEDSETDTNVAAGPPLGIPSFLWGCVPAGCLSPLFGIGGVVLVYFMTDKDKDETKKAVFGCVAGSLVSVAAYVLYYY